MDFRRQLALLTVLGAAAPRGAHAQSAFFQGSVGASGGWTDNIAQSPDRPMPGTTGPQADTFVEFSPTLSLSLASDKAIHRMSYTFSRRQYVSHDEANSNSHRAEWSGLWQPTSTTSLALAASATYGRLNTFNMLLPATQSSVAASVPGGVTFFSALLRSAYSWDVTPKWRATQTTEFSSFVPIDPRIQPMVFDVIPRMALDRHWTRDAIGGEVGLGYTHYSEVTNDTTGMILAPRRQQVTTSGVGRWRHDFTERWSSEIDGGFVFAARANDFGAPVLQPVGFLAGRYTHERIQGELSVSRTVQANPIVGRTFINDGGTLRVSLPLGTMGSDNQISLGGSAGLAHGQMLDVDTGDSVGSVNVWLADAAIAWSPKPEIDISVRYQIFRQLGDVTDRAPLPDISRQAVLFGVSGRYPSEIPTPPRSTGRADERDETFLWGRPPDLRPGARQSGGLGGGGAGSRP